MSYNPDQSLWQAVLQRQVDDALLGTGGISGTRARERATNEARRLLTTQNEDLTMLCDLAGLEVEVVIEAMRERIAAAPSALTLATTRNVSRATQNNRTEKQTEARTDQAAA
ncbi:hypothetical protein [Sulfitobacter sp.]|uniref:hypothetical protein n=1 Tax=Sulfitobacter sp. TaxID=1903071 RepID=UPI003002D12A